MTLELLHFSFPIREFVFIDEKPVKAICWNNKKYSIKEFSDVTEGITKTIEVTEYDTELNWFICNDYYVNAKLEV